jgi:lipopolysaccharide/colanic/teichoic acid biosynthesis glycosyltransferase
MFYKITKRIFDFVCALIGIIGTSPLWIIAIVGILVSDWGPIFYMATRIGKDNKPFKMYKFRSMRALRTPKAGAEASLRPDEDRIFKFGHFIRATKIDELPQLLNILNGTMSIIGPRPVARCAETFWNGKDIQHLQRYLCRRFGI